MIKFLKVFIQIDRFYWLRGYTEFPVCFVTIKCETESVTDFQNLFAFANFFFFLISNIYLYSLAD